MSLISQAIATSLKEQDLIPDALENLAKSTVKRATKPEQTSLPLKENRLYYDKEQNDFFLKPHVAEQQLSLKNQRSLFMKRQMKNRNRNRLRSNSQRESQLAMTN